MPGFGWSVLGGAVGAAVVVAAVGLYVKNGMGVHLPMLVNGVTDSASKSQILVFGTLTAGRKNCTKAKITLEPFKIGVAETFTGLSIMLPLPTSCIPVAVPGPQSVKLYSADGNSTIDGSIQLGPNGVVVIKSPAPIQAGGAWGLAEVAQIEFEIAPK
jgi:hypothetical protein